ncbi:uncharacterized protein LAJ45_08973 [Morchella importuna]|uniref:uncharacterized protein n=1 Tax=Morchella importuna TaxID=1174673 RepID=UPI001E8D0DE0|nr:uncharacterized protein LAJ45_08973 [Morchella importuna]KAH8146894.1 hypothetical protein LAJ45_08973 [Morchella importuna]
MHLYNLNSTLTTPYRTSDIRNCLRLRQDLHTLFDTGAFAFVPKEGKIVIHFLTMGLNYCKTFHNRATESLMMHPAFIYARFAWAILPHATSFTSKKSTRITVFNEETERWEVTTAGETKKPVAAISKRRKHQAGGAAGQEVADAECTIDALDQQPARSRVDTFHKIVSSNPSYAWHAPYWHPETERFDKLREKALQEREPELHRMEKERRRDLLGHDGAPLPDEGCFSFDDDTEEELEFYRG